MSRHNRNRGEEQAQPQSRWQPHDWAGTSELDMRMVVVVSPPLPPESPKLTLRESSGWIALVFGAVACNLLPMRMGGVASCI